MNKWAFIRLVIFVLMHRETEVGGRKIKYKHRGIDIVCNAGSSIFSPIPATVIRQRTPLAGKEGRAHNVGVVLKGRGRWSGM